MPEEIEVPLEHAQEKIQELHEEHDHAPRRPPAQETAEEGRGGWTRFVAVATALMAVVAAVGALQSGVLVNEALLKKNDQIKITADETDQWNYYQAKGIKALITKTAAQTLPPGSPAAAQNRAESERYKGDQEAIKTKAEGLEQQAEKAGKESDRFMDRHHVFAVSVSLCQIAIALSAVAALMRRRRVWFLGLAAGLAGTLLLFYGFLQQG